MRSAVGPGAKAQVRNGTFRTWPLSLMMSVVGGLGGHSWLRRHVGFWTPKPTLLEIDPLGHALTERRAERISVNGSSDLALGQRAVLRAPVLLAGSAPSAIRATRDTTLAAAISLTQTRKSLYDGRLTA